MDEAERERIAGFPGKSQFRKTKWGLRKTLIFVLVVSVLLWAAISAIVQYF